MEDNSFGTHEFFELCEQLGCKTYVNGNVGSGSVQEMSEWVEYATFEGVSPMADLRKANGHEQFFHIGRPRQCLIPDLIIKIGCASFVLPSAWMNIIIGRRYYAEYLQ